MNENSRRLISCAFLALSSALVGCAGAAPEKSVIESTTARVADACGEGRAMKRGRCEVVPLIEPSAIDTSCPPGTYNDMSQRCVTDEIRAQAASTSQVVVAAPAPPPAPKDVSAMVHIAGFGRVAAFDLDVTEVTVKAYAACVAGGACTAPSAHDDPDLFGLRLDLPCNAGATKRDHPVNCVSFADAKAYCAWAGKRLPRPAEWVLAAGGPEARTYPWGAKAPVEGDLCGGKRGTCPVGSHPLDTTPDGVKDMAGNVTEWTDDEFPGRGGGVTVEVFVFGGNWFNTNPQQWDYPSRSVASFVSGAEEHSALGGFRCAR